MVFGLALLHTIKRSSNTVLMLTGELVMPIIIVQLIRTSQYFYSIYEV
ncbi:unnamed protein product [Periconia digitata]|uniref:Uncharacterized protein n=1 Tax=Periconia digitata TaxID=1303443 RepID=A0A9W4UB79_9PLEO|nr:unnamed protein product [Periconia digitata]